MNADLNSSGADPVSTLLIDDGSLAALATLVTLPAGASVALWQPTQPGDEAEGLSAVLRLHATLLAEARIDRDLLWPIDGNAHAPAEMDALTQSAMLLQAVAIARRHGAARVLWPLQVGLDDRAVTAAVDLAATVTDLLEIAGSAGDRSTARIVIDLPMIDLEDNQIVDLADDAGAPMRGFWPCGRAELTPCGACQGCARWLAAFDHVGLVWPWGRVAAPA